MKKQRQIKGIHVMLRKDPEIGVSSCYDQVFMPVDEFIKLVEPEIKRIARETTHKALHDKTDCG